MKRFFEQLDPHLQEQITDLLAEIFPTVRHFAEPNSFLGSAVYSQEAARTRKIYHPDFFPRYFIHHVPANLFGQEEMKTFIVQLNSQSDFDCCVNISGQMIERLSANSWKRWSFFDSLIFGVDQLKDMQAEALAKAIMLASDTLEADFLALGEWGRARSLVFSIFRRFAGTPRMQTLIAASIKDASSNKAAGDILRYCTSMKGQNNVITDWRDVSETALTAAFIDRMRDKYRPGSNGAFPYRQEDVQSFNFWIHHSPEDRRQEIAFFEHRFGREPSEIVKFLSWLLREDVTYPKGPIAWLNHFFPVDMLLNKVETGRDIVWSDSDQGAVEWFLELASERPDNSSTDTVASDAE